MPGSGRMSGTAEKKGIIMNIQDYVCPSADEKPLETLNPTGGMTAIFRRIACVGDSLASGELETWEEHSGRKVYLDLFEHSWGQYLARMTGATVYNFSKGGMTAKEFIESFADSKNFWDPKLASDAYIFALGVNDLIGRGMEIGSCADIDPADWKNNKPTFAGWFGKVVQRYRAIQPAAPLFFITMPRENTDPERTAKCDAHAELMYSMAEFFGNAYVVDLRRYGPVYDRDFKSRYYGGGHLNTMGYYFTALEIASYIDWIIRHNAKNFSSNGLAGLPYTLC